jgi:tRNA pseudouridine65 synthase
MWRPPYTGRVSCIPILYRDEHLLAVNKPAGMLVHRSAIDRAQRWSVVDAVRAHTGVAVHPLHRLDRAVGGVLLFALHVEAARRMTALFADRTVHKTYLAVVRGHAPEQGVIEHALREVRDGISDARARSAKPPQAAVTAYERLALAELPLPGGRYPSARFSLVRAWPRTGRKHQVRRHFKHIAHPIIGDTTHGDGRQNRLAREHLGCERMLLYAREVSFEHPFSNQPVCITALLDAHFEAVMRRLGWQEQGATCAA